MTSVPIVRLDDVSKHFTVRKDKSLKERIVNAARGRAHAEHFEALKHISLEIDSGSTVGLIGPNGSGKSTLLKTIGGIIQPSSGTVERRGRMAALLELGAGFHPDLTGRENVYLNASILGLSERQTDQYFDAIVDFSGIEQFIDQQVKFYSSGMYVRLAFAVAVHVDPDLLLVDEVLAVGDEAFQEKCLEKIRSFQLEGRTIVLVTHTLSQITDLCTRGVVLSRGSMVFDGPPIEAVEVLRGGFRSQREYEDARKEHVADVAAQEQLERVTIDAVRLVDEHGSTTRSVHAGSDVTLEVDLTAIDPIEDWRLGVSIANGFGQTALFTTTERLGLDPKRLAGPARIRFAMPDLHLGAGSYVTSVSLERRSGGELARAQDAVTFQVDDDGASVGIARTALRVHVEPR
ncbi:ABC-2 type transport system ATP-binding protein [Agrococcus baldri]|uniref:ABC-2 type transport system ATP-binding protein n=1 Tax=Agrococcus baldri TaxID=153730 RepID=A0AA94HN94_9MICO|nr:ABC transporter ATP-binding protein [Agrococcus baldri]SFS14082.1 ABC-2 type transport system ATP-binding protein [Agrococcus baldri]